MDEAVSPPLVVKDYWERVSKTRPTEYTFRKLHESRIGTRRQKTQPPVYTTPADNDGYQSEDSLSIEAETFRDVIPTSDKLHRPVRRQRSSRQPTRRRQARVEQQVEDTIPITLTDNDDIINMSPMDNTLAVNPHESSRIPNPELPLALETFAETEAHFIGPATYHTYAAPYDDDWDYLTITSDCYEHSDFDSNTD
ncbi:hypothetical protein HDU67_002588 [Dinochytrium kinnereticum]|nr:hypothetical protein HDU67_002588 [Dinochytrium kinnereticum]